MSVELVLAPDVTDSVSSLSCPHTDESINSLIKDLIYIRIGDEDQESFSTLGGYVVSYVDIDSRKCLHLATKLSNDPGALPFRDRLWGCRCRVQSYVGTEIYWISLADFDVDAFKLVSDSPSKLTQLIVNSVNRRSRSRRKPALSSSAAPMSLPKC